MKRSDIYINNRFWDHYSDLLPKLDQIYSKKKSVLHLLDNKFNEKFWTPYSQLPQILNTKQLFDQTDYVTIYSVSEIDQRKRSLIHDFLLTMKPWRKGPFDFFGIDIDAEWKSNLKWDRVKDHVDIKGKKIADIGCNNCYYMYRMLQDSPELVVGFDPMVRYYFNYLFLDKYINNSRAQFELFGVDELSLFPSFYDTILFMGVLYHRRDPLQTLKTINESLIDDGQLIIECMGIPGEGDLCLFPEDKYTKAPGYWFLPTVGALSNMLKRTNFCDIELIESHKLSTDEQRNTSWVGTESLSDFLDPNDKNKTVEGYPAPIRIYMKARKKYNKQIHKYKKNVL